MEVGGVKKIVRGLYFLLKGVLSYFGKLQREHMHTESRASAAGVQTPLFQRNLIGFVP